MAVSKQETLKEIIGAAAKHIVDVCDSSNRNNSKALVTIIKDSKSQANAEKAGQASEAAERQRRLARWRELYGEGIRLLEEMEGMTGGSSGLAALIAAYREMEDTPTRDDYRQSIEWRQADLKRKLERFREIGAEIDKLQDVGESLDRPEKRSFYEELSKLEL